MVFPSGCSSGPGRHAETTAPQGGFASLQIPLPLQGVECAIRRFLASAVLDKVTPIVFECGHNRREIDVVHVNPPCVAAI